MSELSLGETVRPLENVGELLRQHDADPYGYLAQASMIYDWGINKPGNTPERLEGLHVEVALAGAHLEDPALFDAGWQGIQQPLTKWRVYAEAMSGGAGIVMGDAHLDELTTMQCHYETIGDYHALASIEIAKLRINMPEAPTTDYEWHDLNEQLRIITGLIAQHAVGSQKPDREEQAHRLRGDLAEFLLGKGLFDDALAIADQAQDTSLSTIITDDILLHKFVPLAEAGKFKLRAWRKEVANRNVNGKSQRLLLEAINAFSPQSPKTPYAYREWVRKYRPARYAAWYATESRASGRDALPHMSTLLNAGYISQARELYYDFVFAQGQPWQFDNPAPCFAMSILLARHDTAGLDPTTSGHNKLIELGATALGSAAYPDAPLLYGHMAKGTTDALSRIQAMPYSAARIVAALELANVQPLQEGKPMKTPALLEELKRSLTVLTRLSRSRKERIPAQLKPLFESFGVLPFRTRVDYARYILPIFESTEADDSENRLPDTDL